ncbi:MAG TPA: response regulator [Burkholderiales bacterium]|nr:response regulator [Burkholderiales bacterium]
MDVLLVDDHPIIHETMRAIVRAVRPEADFHGQFDLEGGLAQAERLRDLRLLLVDLGLPGCAGLDALRRFRAALPGTPIAVISATEDAERIAEAMREGAVGYLPKTLLPKTMAAAIGAILDGGVFHPPAPAC